MFELLFCFVYVLDMSSHNYTKLRVPQLLCMRIGTNLDASQSVDQAGFRCGFSCDDHLLAIALVMELCTEHRLPLCVCAVDFEKALLEQGVEAEYVHLLAAIYEGQCGHVCGGILSRAYKIERGTKQGDPIAPIFFNAALEQVMVPLQAKWQRKGWGVPVENGEERRLTNLRFADDILLLASTPRQMKQMIKDLMSASGSAGLARYFGKTKVLSNDPENNGGKTNVGACEVERLPYLGSADYLGRKLDIVHTHDVEIRACVRKASEKFFALKDELCSRHAGLTSGLELFNASVTPTLLYGRGSRNHPAAHIAMDTGVFLEATDH